jgi:adenylate cyclase
LAGIRKLAAILASDVVGYCRLAGADEDRTLARLRALRSDLVDPVVSVHHGRIVKRTGDGSLIEFRSVVDAVRCAIEVQSAMVERNAGVSPEKRIEFRIGIHLGDVVEEADGDLMGDGINIASRLEGVAEPNGVCISGAAYEQVRDKLLHQFVDLGDKDLKNIARPVRVYRLAMDLNPTKIERFAPENPPSRLPLPDKPSIAVLPFQNMSGDLEQEYFADGIVEDIITALSRTKSLFVIARNSSFAYKGKSFDVRQVGRELGVRYVLEGSVRKAAARLRITCQLIDTTSDRHIWADRFDGAIEEVFELQDRVTARVVATIEPALAGAEMERARTKHTSSLTAYDCFLRALAALRIPTKPGLEEGLALCRQAIALDPNYASAYGVAAWCCMQRLAHGWAADGDHKAGAEFARHAIEVGGDDPTALSTAALALGMLSGDLDRAAAALDRSLMLNPNSAQALMFSSFVHSMLGDAQTGVDHAQRAMRLSPLDPIGYRTKSAMGLACLIAGRMEEAIDWQEKALHEHSHYVPALIYKIAGCVAAGRIDDAREAGRLLMQLVPDETITSRMSILRLRRPEDRALLVCGLRQAGVPE